MQPTVRLALSIAFISHAGWGYYPTGGIGVLLLIVIILLLIGYI